MDILDQVSMVVSDFDKKGQSYVKHTSLAKVLALTELVALHNKYLSDRQWDSARDCLRGIARLANRMLDE